MAHADELVVDEPLDTSRTESTLNYAFHTTICESLYD